MPNLNLLISGPNASDYASFRDAYRSSCVVQFANSIEKGLEYLKGEEQFDAAIFELEFPPYDTNHGLDNVLPIAARWAQKKHIPLIIISEESSPAIPKRAQKHGANAFLLKTDYNYERFFWFVKDVITAFKAPPLNKPEVEQPGFVTRSIAMEDVKTELRALAEFPHVFVLLHGETGVGKEAAARFLHHSKNQSKHTLFIVNLKALPAELIYSKLFGHIKGAFTGAEKDAMGVFEEAGRGTILLDEFGVITEEAQEALLSVLSNREFQKVGSNQTMRLEAQVLLATNADLYAKIGDGTFRTDIYYRINRKVRIPPLRERKEEIRPLIEYFLPNCFSSQGHPFYNKSVDECITTDALKVLEEYYWPGNIRELRNVLQNLVIDVQIRGKKRIDLDMIPHQYRVPYVPQVSPVQSGKPTEHEPSEVVSTESVPSFISWPPKMVAAYHELQIIESALKNSGGRKGDTAIALGYNSDDNLRTKVTSRLNKFPDLKKYFEYLKMAYKV